MSELLSLIILIPLCFIVAIFIMIFLYDIIKNIIMPFLIVFIIKKSLKEKDPILKLLTGPMFAGKTFKLIKLILSDDRKKIVIKSIKDTRKREDKNENNNNKNNNNNSIYSRDSKKEIEPDFITEKLLDLYKNEKFQNKLKECSVIYIDEGQFFDDLNEFVLLLQNNKSITIAAINKFANKQDWPCIKELIEQNKDNNNFEIIELKSKCDFCGKREGIYSFNKKENINLIKVGDSSDYGTCCEKCFPKE